MSKVLVFGASGFIGRAFVDLLIKNNHEPILVAPNLDIFEDKNYEKYMKVLADFSTINTIYDKLNHISIEFFVYLAWAGYGKSTNDYNVQIQNIKPLCDAVVLAKSLGCSRFVFTSSFSEYMIREDEVKSHTQGASANVYGSVKNASRIVAHSVAKLNNIDYVSVAFANTFGPGDYSSRTPNKFISNMLANNEINLTKGDHLYDWNYIDDTVNGLYLATFYGVSDEFYYIGNRIQKPLKEIVYDIKDILKSKSLINLDRFKEDFYLDYSSIDVNKLYRHTGYLAKVSFEDAIQKTAKWVLEKKL